MKQILLLTLVGLACAASVKTVSSETTQSVSWMPLAIVGAVGSIFVLFKLNNYRATPLKGVPAAKPHWFLGHLPEMVSQLDRWHHFVYESMSEHGRVFSLCAPGGQRSLFTSHPEDVKYIMKENHSNFEKSKYYFRDILEELLGDGIFNISGHEWKRQRKVASPMFSMSTVRDVFYKMAVDHAKTFLSVMDTRVVGQPSVDMQDMFFRYTFDVICSVAYGVSFDTVTNPPDNSSMTFASAFDDCQEYMFRRFFDPFWRMKRVFSIGTEGKIKKCVAVLEALATEIVESRKKMNSKIVRSKPDLLSRFVTYAQQTGEFSSDKELRDIVMNFMIAGRDTTAIFLTWTFYCVCKHPAEAEKVIAELKAAGFTKDYMPSYKELMDLPLLDAFLQEVLRLYPPVPIEGQWAIKEDTLPSGCTVPPGCCVAFNPWAFNRQEAIWKNATEFRPERWADASDIDPYKFPVFNAGLRLCLGKQVAYMECKLIAVLLLSRYSFKLTPEDEGEAYAMAFVQRKQNGLMMSVRSL